MMSIGTLTEVESFKFKSKQYEKDSANIARVFPFLNSNLP